MIARAGLTVAVVTSIFVLLSQGVLVAIALRGSRA